MSRKRKQPFTLLREGNKRVRLSLAADGIDLMIKAFPKRTEKLWKLKPKIEIELQSRNAGSP